VSATGQPRWNSSVSNYYLGLGIVLIPFFNFLSTVNLAQLESNAILFIGLSLIPFVLGAYFLSWGISKVVTNFFAIEVDRLFPLICTGFYLQFFYFPLREQLHSYLDLSLVGYDSLKVKALALILLGSFWLAILLLGVVYPRIVKRSLAVFTSLVLALAMIPSLSLSITNVTDDAIKQIEPTSYMSTKKLDQYTISNLDVISADTASKTYPNIYFVIADGMMSLENAEELEIVERQGELKKLNKMGLTYIKNSVSSYDATKWTLASIMQLDYLKNSVGHTTNNDDSHTFPKIMYAERDNMGGAFTLPIFYVLNKVNAQFIWQGNGWQGCIFSHSWLCSFDLAKKRNRVMIDVLSGLKIGTFLGSMYPFYRQSMVGGIIIQLNEQFFVDHDVVVGKHTLAPFMNTLDNVVRLDQPVFALIHHLVPHRPHLVTETCEKADVIYDDSLIGYRASYRCVLLEIRKFLEKVNTVDPSAIVVIQGDHGSRFLEPIDLSEEETVRYMMGIFNVIKAPKSCFDRYGTPLSSVNSIRFALNCAYGFRFPLDDAIHYRANELGFFISETKEDAFARGGVDN